ncbi:hypothetical protein C8Q74DRAFT_1190978 [Fomes fomentarius]|nr:hypothetical protein C8Q74DRAFT_1190978 [Fomes fomentarius]
MVRRIIPSSHHYAVIRMDPVAMVEGLGLDDDLETLAEARAMQPRKYLVYLSWPEELVQPKSRWCRFQVKPIGTTLRTLRPEDSSRGITSDMVVPIAPNTAHSRGGEPLHPTPSFPFSNCFHWIQNDMEVRVRVPKGGVEHDGAIRLTAKEHRKLNKRFKDDYERIATFTLHQRASSPSTDSISVATAVHDQNSPNGLRKAAYVSDEHLSLLYRRIAYEQGVTRSIPPESLRDDNSGSSLDESSESSSGSTSVSSLTPPPTASSGDSLAALDIFRWDPDPITGLLPLVDVWLDIDKHLTPETIPDPTALQEEERTIIS